MSRSSAERYTRSPGIIARRVAGELLLVPLGVRSEKPDNKSAEFFVVNRSGELLWEELAQVRSVDELAQALMERYELDPARARSDVDNFVQELEKVGAITRAEE